MVTVPKRINFIKTDVGIYNSNNNICYWYLIYKSNDALLKCVVKGKVLSILDTGPAIATAARYWVSIYTWRESNVYS